MAQVDAQLSTSVALNTLSAQQSLKGLTQAVKLSTDSWKINERQLKSSGEYVKAVQAKYDGLARTIKLQQNHVDGLKKKQAELNVENEHDARTYAKLTAEIGRESTKLISLESQYDKTGKQVQYYKSGLADLQKTYHQNKSLSESTIERLEAEGKQRAANAERATLQKNAVTNLTAQYKKQVAELKQVEANEGRTSSAYKEQQIRINQTATAMAKARVKNKELNDTGEKSHGIFKASFLGNLGASIAIRGLDAVKESTIGLLKTGIEYNKEQDKMRGVWKSLTTEAPKDGQQLLKYINDVGSHSIYAADTIDEMAQSFYHVHSNVKETESWTKSFVALGSTLQMTDSQLAESGEMFGKIVAGGKAGAADLDVMIQRFPMFGEAIQHATGKSMKQIRAMSAAGKLSAADFTKTLDYLGKKYADGTNNAMQTYGGMSMYLKSRFAKLSSDVTKNGFNMSKSTLTAIRQVTNDKSMDMYSKAISAAFAGTLKVVTGILKVIVDNRKTIMNVIGDMMRISGAIGGVGKAIGKVATAEIKSVLDSLGGFFKALTGGGNGKSLTDNIVGMLNGFAKNKVAVKAVTNSILALLAFKSVSRSIKFTADLIDHTGNGIRAVGRNFDRIKKGGKAALHFTATIIDKTKKVLTAIGRLAIGTGKLVGRSIKWVAKVSVKAAIGAFKVLRAAAIMTGTAMKAAFNFLKANPWALAITAIVALGVALVELYKHNKKFRKFVNGIVSSCKDLLARAIKPVKKLVKQFKSTFSAGFKAIKNIFKVFADLFTGNWKDLGGDVRKAIISMWKYWKSLFKSGYTFLNTLTGGRLGEMLKLVKSVGSAISKSWKGVWNGLTSFFEGIWKKMKSLASDGVNGVIKIIRGLIGGINGVIHMFGGKTQTIEPPSYVHFATGTGYGTRRAITRPTPAIVNDGPEADNREIILRANGAEERPQAQNHKTLLLPGDEVLNATESKEYDSQRQHFAKGTGFWSGIGSWASKTASGVGSWVSNKVASLKNLFDTATKVLANPGKALESLVSFSTKGMGGVMANIGKGAFNMVKDAGKNWWSQLWSMVDLDGSAAGGSWLHSPGAGWTHTSGFGYRGGGSGGQSMHDGNDFSAAQGTTFHAVHGGKVVRAANAPGGWGAVGYDIVTKGDDGKYIIYQEFGHASDSKVKVGDVVKTGQAIGKLGRSGLGSGPHVHIGVSDNYPFNNSGSTTRGWLDLLKMHGTSSGTDKTKSRAATPSNGMAALIKKQVGSGFWSTISKIAEKFGDAGNPGGYGATRWIPSIKKAAKAMHVNLGGNDISRILNTINHESGGNPTVWQHGYTDVNTGRDPARGLLQFIGSTFRHYAVKGHGNRANGYDQLLALFNDSNWRHDLMWNGGWAPSGHRRYANGGIVSRNQIAEIAEGNKPESIIPWDINKRGRAYQLLGKTVAHFAATDATGNTGGTMVGGSDMSSLEAMAQQTNQLLATLIQAVNDKPVISNNEIYSATQTVAAKKTKLANYAKGRFGL